MTTYATLLDRVAEALAPTTAWSAPAPVPGENPHHRALLETFVELHHQGRQLDDEARSATDAADSTRLLDLLIARLASSRQLTDLLIAPCSTHFDPAPLRPTGPAPHPRPDCDAPHDFEGILTDCRRVFTAYGEPDTLASTDLVAALRRTDGPASGRWDRTGLTPRRLAALLAPYEIRPRDVTLADGTRRKGYRRAALLHTQPC